MPRARVSLAILVFLLVGVPGPARAQSVLDQLNRILGRGADPVTSEPRPESGETSPRSASPGEARSASRRHAGPAVLGYVDLPALIRLHPIMRYLVLSPDKSERPQFMKGAQVARLRPPPAIQREQEAARRELQAEYDRSRSKLAVLMTSRLTFSRRSAAALNKAGTTREARRVAEEQQFTERERLDAQIEDLATRVQDLRRQLEGGETTSPAIDQEYLRRIRRDLDEALDVVAAEAGVDLVLNIPANPRRTEYVDDYLRKRFLPPGQANPIARFLGSEAAGTGDRGVLVSLLNEWEEALRGYPEFLPLETLGVGVLRGGVELTGRVLDTVWTKYKVPEPLRRVGVEFIQRR